MKLMFGFFCLFVFSFLPKFCLLVQSPFIIQPYTHPVKGASQNWNVFARVELPV